LEWLGEPFARQVLLAVFPSRTRAPRRESDLMPFRFQAGRSYAEFEFSDDGIGEPKRFLRRIPRKSRLDLRLVVAGRRDTVVTVAICRPARRHYQSWWTIPLAGNVQNITFELTPLRSERESLR
jgi:hypothetical protein